MPRGQRRLRRLALQGLLDARARRRARGSRGRGPSLSSARGRRPRRRARALGAVPGRAKPHAKIEADVGRVSAGGASTRSACGGACDRALQQRSSCGGELPRLAPPGAVAASGEAQEGRHVALQREAAREQRQQPSRARASPRAISAARAAPAPARASHSERTSSAPSCRRASGAWRSRWRRRVPRSPAPASASGASRARRPGCAASAPT